MRKRVYQFALAVAAMVMVGSVYGWSTTAAILSSSSTWSARQAAAIFGILATGIGAGVVISGLLVPALGYAKTISAGLITWGLTLFVLSELGFARSLRIPLVIWAVVAGAGVGIAYLALVGFFRNLFIRPTVISGLIGPLGFASGAAIISVAQAIRPSIEGVLQVYRAFGIGSLALGVLVSLILVEPAGTKAAVKTRTVRDGRSDLVYLWALLSLNVVPGMAVIAIAVPWFNRTRPWSLGQLALALCAALFSLPFGQTVWGLIADRFGDRVVFLLMFFIRALLFTAASISPQSVWPWSLSFVCLACHGGGFGVIPKMVAKSRLGSDSRLLGIVLSGWGVGGVIGVVAILSAIDDSLAFKGYALIAGLMATGVVLSVRYRVA